MNSFSAMKSLLPVVWVGTACLISLLAVRSAIGADPVKVSVYYECLCSDSRNFVIKQLHPVWRDLKDIMTLDINTYGKANDTAHGEGYAFHCQHGPAECEGNMMLTCAKNYLSEAQYMDFSACIMESFISTRAEELCAELIGIDSTPIHNCWNSVDGQMLLHEVGEIERTLDPPLTYVPWILINDVYTEEQRIAAEADLRGVICNAYQGEKPPQCLVAPYHPLNL
ncbi:gamma-interferon-inducible lysosomal thiol reductase-like [Palaemon carinicauda]|uniref:gamma-interferon-inducible lysosomal thiol reductase-like n=1 Tax=Palaemon carinicauda TaxID=392227 RepID=UPI0035B5FE88